MVPKYETRLSIHWISRPTKPCNSRQNRTFTLIFPRSKLSCNRLVPSCPLLSKSNKRITSQAPSASISWVASRKDLPPVFTVKIAPLTPKSWRACASFLPSTTMGLPFADSSTSLARACSIFSTFSLRCVDKLLPCNLCLAHGLQAVFGFFVIFKVSADWLKDFSKFGCNTVFEVHRMQFTLRIC